ncbi:MAG: GNAT family N-acetyltransferase [Treponema sp.]|jgi:GNAT superfamily N-acetyltransferase|nr:GNAT family N-acetyltransferase [Treponema sp.]
MQFELTEALIEDILFSMEDQVGDFYLDTLKGVVAGGEDFEDEDPDSDIEGRYISLPEWDSSSGFRLMERFAAGCRNPLIREELSSALNRGKGVFRAFKDVLTRRPEAEKLWFAYKEREMQYEIIRWYNALREEWGLEKIGLEPEETGDLILEDFRFRELTTEDIPRIKELHALCLVENRDWMRENGIFVEEPGGEEPAGGEAGRTALAAESGSGEFSGYVLAIREGSVLRIRALEVKPEYRGMGIGEALLIRLLEKTEDNQVSQALFDLPANAEGFSRVLDREGFKPYMTRYSLRLRDRCG